MNDPDNWQTYKSIIAHNMLVQARCGLLNVLQKRAEPHTYIKYQNSTWRVDRVEPGEKIPTWTTRAWLLINDSPKDYSNSSLDKLAIEWGYIGPDEETPGNALSFYTTTGSINNYTLPLLVFGKIQND